jgi:DNA adenine methylase
MPHGEYAVKPILKWVGEKRQLLSEIAPLIPPSPSLYVEPFVGGAAVLLDRQPDKALINDLNEELINVYRVVRDDPDNLIELLERHENTSEHYYEVRAMDRSASFSKLSNAERAARIIYLNKTCYNGMFRVNSQGQLNVPYGRYKHPNIVNEPGIKALSAYLQGCIDIRCGDYAAVLKDLPENSFVYLDPPYMPVSATSACTSYTEGGFGYDEQVRLRNECLKLREQDISFLESNSDCPEIRELYKDFNLKTVKARRSINSKGDKRGAVNEVLISG